MKFSWIVQKGFSVKAITSLFLILILMITGSWAAYSNRPMPNEDEFYFITENSGAPGLHLNSPARNDETVFLQPLDSSSYQGSLQRPIFQRIILWPQFNQQSYDLPIILNDSVKAYIDYFQTEIPDRFTVWLGRSTRYLPMMTETFRKQGIPEDLVYMSLIESGFNPLAHSRAHAVGPWQFMKGTGRMYGLRVNQWVDERRDPVKSTDAAARHMKDLYERFGDWPLAMAAYNAGERRIRQALKRGRVDNYWDLRKTRHIRRETKGYVPKFTAATIIAKQPESFGFYPEYDPPFEYDEVTVPGSASLRMVAKAAGISYKGLRQLNPELRIEITPPYKSKYSMKLPKGSKANFETRYAQIPDDKKIFRSQYVVRRHDTLSGIAKRYGTTVGQLAEMNNRSPRKILRVGEVIYIPKSSSQAQRQPQRKSFVQTVSQHSSQGVAVASAHQTVYRVQPGDTLWDISRTFKVSLSTLKRNNGMGRNTRIYPGDILILSYK